MKELTDIECSFDLSQHSFPFATPSWIKQKEAKASARFKQRFRLGFILRDQTA